MTAPSPTSTRRRLLPLYDYNGQLAAVDEFEAHTGVRCGGRMAEYAGMELAIRECSGELVLTQEETAGGRLLAKCDVCGRMHSLRRG